MLPLPPAEVIGLLANCELLFRLNPLYAIERWTPQAGGFNVVAQNESNGRRIETDVVAEHAGATLLLRYATGLKQASCFAIESDAAGTRFIVTERYPRIADPQDPRVAEVDKSLVPWVAALRRHLLARWRWLPGWRWWHEKFMPSMPPRQRRIVRLLIWTSILEFAVFIGLVIVLRSAA